MGQEQGNDGGDIWELTQYGGIVMKITHYEEH